MVIFYLSLQPKKLVLGPWGPQFCAGVQFLWHQWVANRPVPHFFADSSIKMIHWLLIFIGLISKSLKYSYKQLLIWFLPPLLDSILPSPPPHPIQAPGMEALLGFPEHSDHLSVQSLPSCALCLECPLLASTRTPTPNKIFSLLHRGEILEPTERSRGFTQS